MRLKLTRCQRVPHRLLSRYGEVGAKLDANLEALDKAEARRFDIAASLGESVSSSGDADSMGRALAAVERIIGTIVSEADQMDGFFQVVHGLVSAVAHEDTSAGLVLSYWYEGGLTAREIAKKMSYSEKTVYERLKRGLDLAFELLAEERGRDDEEA